MEDSINGDLRRDKLQDLLACAKSWNASTPLVSLPHALSLVIIHPSQNHVNRLIEGLNIGLSDHPATHDLRLVLTAYALELVLRRDGAHHGHQRRRIQIVVVSDRLSVSKLSPERSVGPLGRLQLEQRTSAGATSRSIPQA